MYWKMNEPNPPYRLRDGQEISGGWEHRDVTTQWWMKGQRGDTNKWLGEGGGTRGMSTVPTLM